MSKYLEHCEIKPLLNFGNRNIYFISASGDKFEYLGYISAEIKLSGYTYGDSTLGNDWTMRLKLLTM